MAAHRRKRDGLGRFVRYKRRSKAGRVSKRLRENRCRHGHLMREGNFRVYRYWSPTRKQWVQLRQCVPCMRRRDRERRHKLKEAGACVDCGKGIPKPGYRRCDACLLKHKHYYVYGTTRMVA